jgi:hypothetical protein
MSSGVEGDDPDRGERGNDERGENDQLAPEVVRALLALRGRSSPASDRMNATQNTVLATGDQWNGEKMGSYQSRVNILLGTEANTNFSAVITLWLVYEQKGDRALPRLSASLLLASCLPNWR